MGQAAEADHLSFGFRRRSPALTAVTAIRAATPTSRIPPTIWIIVMTRAASVRAVMSPKPTVLNAVSASVRVRDSQPPIDEFASIGGDPPLLQPVVGVDSSAPPYDWWTRRL